uniref:glucuronosyltransferase n=1 Tax=Acrobeloides nanus TaxID=290746 RepID=A0A914D3C5_9BILA
MISINGVTFFYPLITPDFLFASSNTNTSPTVSTVLPPTPSDESTRANLIQNLKNIDVPTSNIDVPANSDDLNNIDIQPLNNMSIIGVPEISIVDHNSSAPIPEVQVSNNEIPKEHHQRLIKNKISCEINPMLYIRGLHCTMTEEKLKEKCDQYGKIISINIIKDKKTKESKGYGFVKFETQEAARSAIKGLKGNSIHAEFAKKRGPKIKNKTPEELFAKEQKRLDSLRKSQAKHRKKRKGQMVFINPANIIQILNEYVSNGHDVVMVMPEYMPLLLNGTKLGKVFLIPNLGGAYTHGVDSLGDDMFSYEYDAVNERIKFEKVLNSACEEVMLKQEELDQLRQYNFDLAITEMIDFCGPFKSWMEKGKNGVVLFSFGTVVPTLALTPERKREIFRALGEFENYHFIVKIDKEDDLARELAKDAKNIDVIEWVPQADLLGDARIKLFIMHAGSYGLLESATRGVPVITIPIFGDQMRNGKIVEYHGWGVHIDKTNLGYATLKIAINKVLSNPSYKENAVHMSKLMKEKPFSPEERFLKWTNFAIKYGNIPELQLEAAQMGFIEYFCLDIISIVTVLLCLILYLSYRFVRFIVSLFV